MLPSSSQAIDPAAPIQLLNPDEVLDMLSEGRLPNISSEIQGVEDEVQEEEEEDVDKKPEVLDVEINLDD